MKLLEKLNKRINYQNIRFLQGPKRKYPINTDDVNQLPVFQYKASSTSYKRVFSWGNALTGALGLQGLHEKKVMSLRFPKRLTFGEKFQVTTAATGYGFSAFAINSDTDVKLYGTGLNTDCQIGYHETQRQQPLEVLLYPQPISLPFKNPKTSKILKLSAGRAHLLVLSDEGVFTLGNNAYGQCGRKIVENEDHSRSGFIHHIESIEGKKIIDIECGQDHSMLLAEDGSVYSCGWGADGQTGLNHYKNTQKFTKVSGDIGEETIVKLACRSDFVLALNDKGQVFGWGNTEYGQISLPSEKQQLPVPTSIEMLKQFGKITSIASGGSFCLVANEHGEVFTWGFGLLGLGPNVQLSKKPFKIPDTLFGKNDFQPSSMVTRVACGLSHAAAITNFGDLYTWGRNKSCCLGIGTEQDQYFPLKVSLGGSVDSVFCGIDHTIALCKPFI